MPDAHQQMRITYTTSPCRDCADRALGCHGHCAAYAAYEARNAATREIKREKALAHGVTEGYKRSMRKNAMAAKRGRTNKPGRD